MIDVFGHNLQRIAKEYSFESFFFISKPSQPDTALVLTHPALDDENDSVNHVGMV